MFSTLYQPDKGSLTYLARRCIESTSVCIYTTLYRNDLRVSLRVHCSQKYTTSCQKLYYYLRKLSVLSIETYIDPKIDVTLNDFLRFSLSNDQQDYSLLQYKIKNFLGLDQRAILYTYYRTSISEHIKTQLGTLVMNVIRPHPLPEGHVCKTRTCLSVCYVANGFIAVL